MCTLRTAIAIILLTALPTFAQGSIYGTVSLSGGGAPAESALRFFGYIDGTDDEVRLAICDGSGYDGINWWDDFQNYGDEAPGLPYRYLFFVSNTGEGAELSAAIPNNSFQQENITLTAADYPESPVVLATAESDAVRLSWNEVTGCSYHVYRRPNGVATSFFRIDDATGNLGQPGLSSPGYLDSDVSAIDQYEYLVIARRADGTFSPPSDAVAAVDGICGDVDASGLVIISDAVYMINYIFAAGPAPLDPFGGDVDCSGDLNITDAVYVINYLFAGGPAPCAGCE